MGYCVILNRQTKDVQERKIGQHGDECYNGPLDGYMHKFATRLGAWLESYASKIFHHWDWFWDVQNNALYHKLQNYWELYKGMTRINICQGATIFDTKIRVIIPPDDIILIQTSVHAV